MIRLNKLPEVGESWCPIVDTAARVVGVVHVGLELCPLRQSGVGGEQHLRVGKCWCGTRRAAAVWLGAPSAIEWSSSSSSSSTYLGILRTVLLKLERRAAAA